MIAKRVPPLVSVEWLMAHTNEADVVVLDASVFLDPAPSGSARGEFRSGLDHFLEKGHIPGARFADLFTEFSDPASSLSFTRPTAAQFEEAAGKLGLRPNVHVITYDALAGQWAARLWWVFRTLGHEKVSVLDGGLKRYQAQGGRLDTGLPRFERTVYRIENEEKPWAHKEEVVTLSTGRAEGTLICLLQPDDFSGEISVRARAGHIPSSSNLPFTKLIDPQNNTMLPFKQLSETFRGVTPLTGERIITYCGGGVASTYGALALEVLGYENTAEYDGYLNEWISDPDLSLETGPGRLSKADSN
ncbi:MULTISPECIES: sulfurtransferase [Agrobacterium]|nr:MULTISPECIES: sulfurtransferase [Agrobacterium]WCK05822.1 sulfurtransferase [Agrobacterium tumefaciens]CUX71830.1 putative 3-mercaptopyruvate sulfurtransferase [Agrobacterium sp. NCPPB 925]